MLYMVPNDELCNIVNGLHTTSGSAKDIATATSDIREPVPNEGVCEECMKV